MKTCPALSSPTSTFGYCPIHNSIATVATEYDRALAGKLNASLKAFAEDIKRGLYPRVTW